MLENKEGTNRSQVAATSYSFGTEHIINQLVGSREHRCPWHLAARSTRRFCGQDSSKQRDARAAEHNRRKVAIP